VGEMLSKMTSATGIRV